MSEAASKFLKELSLSKKHPEFAEELKELQFANQHAVAMLKAGKLTDAEFKDLEGLFFQKTMEALPMDLWESMKADGSLEALQAVAGYEGDRDASEVNDTREATYRKIQADALDEAWLDQRISAEHYARESRNLAPSEDIDAKINNADHDGAAAEMFAARNDVSTHDADLNAYLSKTYGENYRGHDEKPPQEVAKEKHSEPAAKKADPDKTPLQQELAEFLGRARSEPPSARWISVREFLRRRPLILDGHFSKARQRSPRQQNPHRNRAPRSSGQHSKGAGLSNMEGRPGAQGQGFRGFRARQSAQDRTDGPLW